MASASWAAQHDATFVVHYVTTSLDEARDRLAVRNAGGDAHSHRIEPSALEHALTYFVPPSDSEGHRIVLHDTT
jgi:hypothetical protein